MPRSQPTAWLLRLRPDHPVDLREEVDVLARGEIVVEAEPLAHVADAVADLGGVRADVVAEDGRGAAARFLQPAERAHERRLAQAVRADEA